MPNTKLTLSIREQVIRKAKAYADQQHISLSRLVEHYLASLTDQEKPGANIAPWTRELIAVKKPTPDFDHKQGYRDALLEKYADD